mmetsp:Transcript_99160/g.175783  ORF Transcript_99160/g.175783 Transcript_99160/m.175783 type:complete len:578 (-) Transcript_99160:88-1821(-)
MAIILNFVNEGKQAPASPPSLRDLNTLANEVEAKLGLPPTSFEFYDQYGKLEMAEDLHRAVKMAGAEGTAMIEVREHLHFTRIKRLEAQLHEQAGMLKQLQNDLKSADDSTDRKIEAARKELNDKITKTNNRITNDLEPVISDLCRDRTQLQKENRAIQEKISGINVQELRDMTEKAAVLREEVKSSTKRVDIVEGAFNDSHRKMMEKIAAMEEEIAEQKRYVLGKINICIEADGDIKRELQLTNERAQLMNDDLKEHFEELKHLKFRTTGALEESEALRTLLGTVREDNEHLKKISGEVKTRVHCLEGSATEEWNAFAPGILYFRRFHAVAKGIDVQLSADLTLATGRGFLAATGVVMGTDEGLCCGDGPCRRFGTPGVFSSYFEVEIDEICAAPAGAGGLYVGVSLQSGDEIHKHPRHEFDGWLLGGAGKALICRAGLPDRTAEELPPPSMLAPSAFGSDIQSSAQQKAEQAVKLLRAAMPPRPKGEVLQVDGAWDSSGELRMSDRVGILFKCHRDGGARMRISINGELKASHEFIDAPPAEAVGFLTPIVRLAGSGKSVKLLPGLTPPSRMLAE